MEAFPLALPMNLQWVLDKHSFIFDLPKGLPPSWSEHDHRIPLLPSIQPPNVRPYRYLFSQKNEIETIIQDLLAASVIRPRTNPYSYLVVMVLKKEGNWFMCPYFCALNKFTIKDKFPIPVIDDLLDE